MSKAFVIVNSMGGGGAEKTIQTLSNYWIRSGGLSEVTILCSDSTELKYDLVPGVKVKPLPWSKYSFGLNTLWTIPLQAFALARLIKRERPIRCVSFLPRANFVHILSALFFKNELPVCIAEQTSSYEFYGNIQSWLQRQTATVIRLLYPKADLVIAASTAVGASLIQGGLSPTRLTVIPNPIELSAFEIFRQEAIHDAPHKIVTVGRLSPEKDHETLIRAFNLLQKKIPSAKLTIVGEGPERPRLEQLIDSLGLRQSIELPGWQESPGRTLANSDVFVLTSTSEGFGVVLIEAMAAGLPIISTNCAGGPAEILENGKNGILVPVGDVIAIANALYQILTQPELRDELAQKSLRRAQRYAVEDVGEEFLRALLGSKRR